MPLAPEFSAALQFIGGFSWFADCPEFDFDGCWWRFVPFAQGSRHILDSNAEVAHRYFDAHAKNFSTGLEHLLSAHAVLDPHGMSFLAMTEPIGHTTASSSTTVEIRSGVGASSIPEAFDVAISFAGREREFAERLANQVRDAGFEVFYDGYYPAQLWGKNLPEFFDKIYRRSARFCVMFVSREYRERMWTTHERRSANARAVEERGGEYILPIKVDDTEIEGLPPTVGYLSLDQYGVEGIANLLVEKLRAS
jgi:hypothetical protein